MDAGRSLDNQSVTHIVVAGYLIDFEKNVYASRVRDLIIVYSAYVVASNPRSESVSDGATTASHGWRRNPPGWNFFQHQIALE